VWRNGETGVRTPAPAQIIPGSYQLSYTSGIFAYNFNQSQNLFVIYTHYHIKNSEHKPIWGWPSSWLGILEFAPPKVSGSIPSNAKFGGLSPYRVCSGFKWGPTSGQ